MRKYTHISVSIGLLLLGTSLHAQNLLIGSNITHIDSQLNTSSWAAANLLDNSAASLWLSAKQTNDINFVFNAAMDSACFDSFDFTNYGIDDRSIKQFMLLHTSNVALTTDTGAADWQPVIADASPSGLINHLSWAQGGRITSINSELNSTTWAAKHLTDLNSASRWLSSKANNTIEFAFDTNWDGNATDAINVKELKVFNYGADDRSVKTFQVEVTSDGLAWQKLEVPGSAAGEPDFNFTLYQNGATLASIDSQLNSTSWSAKNIQDDDINSRWLSSKGNNTLDFVFDTDGDGSSGASGDADDLFTIEKIYLRNYGVDDRSVRQFQVEVKTTANPNWNKLEVPGSLAGEADFQFLLLAQGGELANIDTQYNSTSWAAKNIHDGDSNTRWLSGKGNNSLDFVMDTDGDGSSGAAGDTDDLFTIEKIYLRNYGVDDRSVKQFQVEVKTTANPNWKKLEVPGSVAGEADFQFLLQAHGGQLANIDTQYNSTSWAAKNIHDGDNNTRWLSGKGNNSLDFVMDTDGDGTSGSTGDTDDLFTIEKIYLRNYDADDRSVRQFQVEVKTTANPNWNKLEVPGSAAGQPNYNYSLSAHGGGLTLIDSEYNSSTYAAKNIHDGDQNSRWLSNKQTNTLAFGFDVNMDGASGDSINLDTIELINYDANDISIQTFEIDIQVSAGAWQPVIAPGGGTVFTANMDSNGQSWAVGPFTNVTATRIRTLTNHGDPSYTGAREISFLGNSLSPSHTFSAAMNSAGETFVLDVADRPSNVTDVRFRTINNHGDPSYIGAREFNVLGPSVTINNTFTAAMHGDGETFVLDASDQPANVTDVRLLTINNHGDPSYIGAREFNVLGPSITVNDTFTAAMHGDGETFVLDVADQPANVTDVRFITINNHGDPYYTGAREFSVLGPSLAASSIFTLPMSTGPHTITLDVADVANNVIGARLITIQNHGDPTYTGLAGLEFRGDPVGPSYIFEANMDGSVQNFSFPPALAKLFRLRTLSNHGDPSYSGANEIVLNSSNECRVGSWMMDELLWDGTPGEVVDSFGNGHDGQALNGLSTDVSSPALSGNPGTCRYGDFDGTSHYVELPGSLPALTASFTIAGWVNARELGGNQRIFVDDETDTGGFALSLGDVGAGRLRFLSRSVSPVAVDTQNAVISPNTWHFVAAVHDNIAKTRQIYVDGVAVSLNAGSTTATYTGTWGNDPGPSSIGGETNNAGTEALPNWRFNGLIDEFQVYRTALSLHEIQSIMGQRHPCAAAGAEHLSLSHSGTAVTCSAEPVTLSAHKADHTIDTGYLQAVNLTTSTSRGDWSIISGNGTLDNAVANDGAASYTFVAADNGTVQLGLKNTVIETLNIDASDGSISETSGAATASEDQNLAFNETGFRFLANTMPGAIGTQISGKDSDIAPGGQALELQAVRTSSATGACEAALLNSNDIELAFECLNPASCSSIPLAINGTDIGANDSGAVSAYTPVALDFGDASASAASFKLNYPDAGQVRLHARYNIPLDNGSPSGNFMSGSSNNFVVKPAGLCVESTDPSADCASGDASCSLFKRAGEAFNLTISGVDWEAAGEADTDFCTGNNVTPNFQLSSIVLTPNLVAPDPGTNTGLGDTSVNIAAADLGSHTTATQSSSEVGVFSILATPPAYLGQTIAASTSANIGRFYPDRFELSLGAVTEACASGVFTYLDQDFSVDYRLTASNTGGVTTANYRDDFIKLNTVLGTVAYGALDQGAAVALSGRLTNTGETFNWNNDGTGDLAVTLNLARLVGPDGPFAADIGVLPSDADGVTIAATDLDLDVDLDTSNDHRLIGQSTQRYGRLFINNAYGPEILDLSLPVKAEFWNSTAFIVNVMDSCTALTDAPAPGGAPADPDSWGDFELSAYTDSLAPGETTPGFSAIVNGIGALDLSAPGAGNVGAVRIDVHGPAWLQFDYDSNAVTPDEDAHGEATFGQYRGNDRVIYWRELIPVQ